MARALHISALLGALALGTLGAQPSRETLGDMLRREGINFVPANPTDLERYVTSGNTLDGDTERILAWYVEHDVGLPDDVLLFRLDKQTHEWTASQVSWPTDTSPSSPYCYGGSIGRIHTSRRFIYLGGHRTPSAECTMVVTKDLQFHDTLYGWVVAQFGNEHVVYEQSQVHFAPTHYVELFLYDAATRTDRQIYPLTPYPPIRHQHIQRVKMAYDRCCQQMLEAIVTEGCPGYFRIRNHHCNPELFDNGHDQIAASTRTDSLAFVASFGDIVAEQPRVVYVYRNVTKGRQMEYVEVLLKDLQRKHGELPVTSYLEPEMLEKLFTNGARTGVPPRSAGRRDF